MAYSETFLIYCKINRIKPNNKDIKMYEFINWVNKRASEFRKENKLDQYHPIARLEGWANFVQKGCYKK